MSIMVQQNTMAPEERNIIASQLAEEISAPVSEYIDTRFGRVRVQRDQPVIFRKGLLGMPDKTSFCLTDFPIQKFARFKLLQSLDDDALSFITLPVNIDNEFITRADIEEGCKDLGFTLEHITLLLIVSVHRDTDGIRLSVNARAPLICDVTRRVADQCVLRNNHYDVRHPLTISMS
jgi:flagellar assembly factor FliW